MVEERDEEAEGRDEDWLTRYLRRRERLVTRLLANLHTERDRLRELLDEASGRRAEEDGVYRFYHRSFKVFRLQHYTERIVEALWGLRPAEEVGLNRWFVEIIDEGTLRKFRRGNADWDREQGRWIGDQTADEDASLDPGTNHRWLEETRPILEAFWHAKYMLQQAVTYAEALEEPPSVLPYGWAAFLYLYDLR